MLHDSEKAAVFKKFLGASTRGWAFAAEQPAAAADLLTELATVENPGLPQPLDAEMVRESQAFIAQVRGAAPSGWPDVILLHKIN